MRAAALLAGLALVVAITPAAAKPSPPAAPKATPKATPRKPVAATGDDGAAESDPKRETRHTVRAGETLGGIASRAEVPRILIIEANGLKPPYGVREGQVLVIPRRRAHVVKPGETGFAIAMDYGVSWSAIAVANGIDPKARVRAGQSLVIPTITKAPPVPAAAADKPDDDDEARPADRPAPGTAAASPIRFAWPAPGKVRRGFVLRAKGVSSSEAAAGKVASRTSPHDGIDIAGAKGDPVRAAAPGLVWFAGKEPNLYGNVVIIDHGRGWFSAYAKLSKVTVRKGELVRGGERVGLIGNTGSTSTTELHFEIRRNTVPRDPESLLPKR
ncbi:MAG: M23 family metallopeptidase [Sphingomonadales bacterium]|nr:M23 family metallopeptidase [Sphingomonadales bacterium]